MENRPIIVALGEVLWDCFPDEERFGGAPANFACHAAVLGAEAILVSTVGDDRHGCLGIEMLQQLGVDTNLVSVLPGATTGTVGVELDAAGKPRFTIHDNAAWDRVEWTCGVAAAVARADALYIGTLGQRSQPSRATIQRALQLAESAGSPRILDVNLRAPFYDAVRIRESIRGASILKLSDDEYESVCGACGISAALVREGLRRLLERFDLELIVMTRGADGALLVSRDGFAEHPGVPVDVVDTVGAGDAFTAAFLLGLLRGDAAETILSSACEVAASVCAHRGAMPRP